MLVKVISAIKTKLRFRKMLSAFGLVEVLIGLAITGGVLISITSVAVSAAQMVNNNEIGDYANNIMLMGIEYFKAPAQDPSKPPAIFLNAINDSVNTKVFKIQTLSTAQASSVSFTQVNGADVGALSECSASDDFRVVSASVSYIVCNKVVVSKEGNGFLITSFVTYRTTNGELRSTKIIGYRQGI